MKESSRRGFLVATGTGVAAAAITPALMSAATANAANTAGGPRQIVAYVNDAKAGTLAIMVGEREVMVTDKDLVARIQSYVKT
ncbi:MAG: twin-arginine translocation signal domain-containing protein [Lapillicoccus sp.]